MQIDTRGLSRGEIKDFYYGMYLFELRMGMTTVDILNYYIQELEKSEEYEGCAGIQKAISVFIEEGIYSRDEEEE